MNRSKPFGFVVFVLIEGVLTLAGIITVITPLALWAVPQHDDISILVYYYVSSVGIGCILVVIALSQLQKFLFHRSSTGDEIKDLEELRQRRTDWEQEQEAKLRAGRVRQTGKGYARRDLGHMARIAGLLTMAFLMIFLPGWALIEFTTVLGAKHTILVVDEDDDDRARIRRLLLRSGYKVLEAQSGHQGLSMLDVAVGINLVLTDVLLSDGMKGSEMMRRAQRAAPKLKAVYIGNKSDEWEIREALGSAAIVVLKPFLATELRAEVRAELARN